MNKNKNVKKKDIKTKKTALSLQNRLAFVQLIVAVMTLGVGVVTICVMKQISNAANLLYIQSDIQQKSAAVLSITDELNSTNAAFPNPDGEERNIIRKIEKQETDAIYALLNTYEFACQQYKERNIDRKVFRHLYGDDTLEYLLDKYKGYISSNKYTSIKNVNKMWR